MAAWECPKCGVANPPYERACRGCRRSRPDGWGDGTWTCQKCGHENSNDTHYCEECGHQPWNERLASTPPSIAQQLQRDILTELQQANASLLAELQGTLAVRPTDADALKSPVRSTGLARASTRGLSLRVDAVPSVNYVLAHAGMPVVRSLELVNGDSGAATDLIVRAWLAPDYGEAWQTAIGEIPPGGRHVINRVEIPLSRVRLQQVREAERATLRVDISTEGQVVQSSSVPVEVLAYNEWVFDSRDPRAAACFVQPNSGAVEDVVSHVRDRLSRTGGDPSLAGYQAGGPDRVRELVQALYETLQQDLSLTYVNPPASFERPAAASDGSFRMSQKVFLPEMMLRHGRGTCLDFTLLAASCLERMGLHPVVLVVRGHAFFGAWTGPSLLKGEWTGDSDVVGSLLSEGDWIVVNSTTSTRRPAVPLATAIDEAHDCLGQMPLLAAIDVVACRSAGFKPIPPLIDA